MGRQTTTSLRNLKSSHRAPVLKQIIRNSVFWCERCRAPSASRLFGCMSHLSPGWLLGVESERIHEYTLGTNPEPRLPTKPALDSRLYMVQYHTQHNRSGHPDIWQPLELSFLPWGVQKYELDKHNIIVGNIFGRVPSLVPSCLLWDNIQFNWICQWVRWWIK